MLATGPRQTRKVTDVSRAATIETGKQTPTDLLNTVVHGDCRDVLRDLPDHAVHAIVSDIPYGIGVEDWDVLHSNSNSAYRGSSPAQETAGAVFRSRGKPLNGWSVADRAIPHEYYEWCASWAVECLRVLKPGGSFLLFAGRRLAHRAVGALEDAGFTVKDTLAWIRSRAPHRAQRLSVVYDRRGDATQADRWQSWRVGNLRPAFEPRGGWPASHAEARQVDGGAYLSRDLRGTGCPRSIRRQRLNARRR